MARSVVRAAARSLDTLAACPARACVRPRGPNPAWIRTLGSRLDTIPAVATDDPTLSAFVEKTIEECRKIGYNPTRFRVMLKQHGAVGALCILLDAKDPSDGYGTLLMKGHLDLTAEAIALRPEYQRHFTKAQRDRARERLAGTPYALADV